MQLTGLNTDSGTAIHPLLGPVRFTKREISWDPFYQVMNTVGVMGERVREDAADAGFRRRAEGILAGLDEPSAVAAVHAHTRGSIRFQRDEITGEGIGGINPEDPLVEVIVRPLDMAWYIDEGVAIGDCDDFSMYAAALLEAEGIPCSFVTVAADARDPGQFSHVYVAAYPRRAGGNRERVAIDCSHGEWPGWEVSNRFNNRKEWPVRDGGGVLTVAAIGLGAWWLWRKAA